MYKMIDPYQGTLWIGTAPRALTVPRRPRPRLSNPVDIALETREQRGCASYEEPGVYPPHGVHSDKSNDLHYGPRLSNL